MKKTTMIIAAMLIASTVGAQSGVSYRSVAKYNNSILGIKADIQKATYPDTSYHVLFLTVKDPSYTAIRVSTGAYFSGEDYSMFKQQFSEAVAIKKAGRDVTMWMGKDSGGGSYTMARSGGAVTFDGTEGHHGVILYGQAKKILAFLEKNSELFN